jgi:hypothetical protein
MRETADREVVLTECEPSALEAMLRFCYTGECRLPKRHTLDLLILADRLDIPELTCLCEKVGFGLHRPRPCSQYMPLSIQAHITLFSVVGQRLRTNLPAKGLPRRASGVRHLKAGHLRM